MRSKPDWAHLIIVKNYHVYASRTGKVPNIYDVISYLWHHPPEGPFSPDGSHMIVKIK